MGPGTSQDVPSTSAPPASRCAVRPPVHDEIWCGYRNLVYVTHPRTGKIEKWFAVTADEEGQVRHLVCEGEGVWVSVRLESALRLFHAVTGELLQEVDIQPFVLRMFGSGPTPHLRVTALSVICRRLWVGTGTGFVISVPLSTELAAGSSPRMVNGAPAGQEDPLRSALPPDPSIPYAATPLAQICFHGHRDAVRFLVTVPATGSANRGVGATSNGGASVPSEDELSKLVVSGGEGYVNFRIEQPIDACFGAVVAH
ncbi:C-Jun-amino-terminal kinase-interacting protein 4-like [Scyliorhinus torazame]|uniref:C-Jun-amino-terminal kinase-interacting protein 4-like n=1 Tax=Scyliorhinus torazame TaxID=75743 RepID=UPI003B58C887